ncbi:induced myeloid leukemia cell differentiation protein Mcl-1 homolog [Coregonus clupeaformis]|uniref:induced myeloid leukemia cell differentiation protein Mcl-1 homolog n=1 Tax=Coregonus clupeaformis TaxID=59861 RepID=UPI001E1C8965|nr:induced myeloid leukemia cell differentiation protein Mcl-1 homolog [Coregonus clupeaformis]
MNKVQHQQHTGDVANQGSNRAHRASCGEPGVDLLDTETMHLMKCLLGECTGVWKQSQHESKALSTMKRVVGQVLERHRCSYNGMINRLSLDDRGDDVKFIGVIATSLFDDGTVNWGRVASLAAFGYAVCQYWTEKGREDCVERVGDEISAYLLTDQRDWLVKHNSWEGFVEFFGVSEPESSKCDSTLSNILMTVAAGAGIVAMLTTLLIMGKYV